MSPTTRKKIVLKNDEEAKPLIQDAIKNLDVIKVNQIIRAVSDKHKLDLSRELTSAVALGNAELVKAIHLYHRKTPKLIPKIVLTKLADNYLHCITFLLDNGFHIIPRDPDLRMFMHSLILNGKERVFKRLMDQGINSNLIDPRTGYSFIHTSCFLSKMKLVKFLIERNANVNATIRKGNGAVPKTAELFGQTALYIAIMIFNIPMIKLLLRKGAKINYNGDILPLAIQRKRKDIIHILLEEGADVNLTNSNEETPLTYCIINSLRDSDDDYTSEIVRMLLEKGADVNATTRSGCTPLFVAVKYGLIKVVRTLISFNADIYATENGYNLIHIAIGASNPEIFDIIWRQIPSDAYNDFINARDSEGQVPLHIGCRSGNIRAVKILLNHNADVNLTDFNGRTPLHVATEMGNIFMMEAVLLKNPDMDIQDNNGQTPLHYAVRNKQNGILLTQCLIRRGARVDVEDIDGRVPLYYACRIKSIQIIDELLENGARINITDNYGQTPLHWTCMSIPKTVEEQKFFELITRNRISVNCVDICGNSPLHFAVANGSLTMVKILLKLGADVNLINENNESALDYVRRNMLYMFDVDNDCDRIAQFLREHVIKLKVAQLHVNEKNIKLAYKVANNDGSVWIQDYEMSCGAELSRLKQKKFDGSDITYYNILEGNINCKINFTFDDKVFLDPASTVLNERFCMYADILKARYKEIKTRRG